MSSIFIVDAVIINRGSLRSRRNPPSVGNAQGWRAPRNVTTFDDNQNMVKLERVKRCRSCSQKIWAGEALCVYDASSPQALSPARGMRQGDVCSSSYGQEASETEDRRRRALPRRALAACHRSAIGALLGGSDRTVHGAEADCVGPSCLRCCVR